MTDLRATPAPGGSGEPATTVADRFILDGPDQQSAPRSDQWLRDWWWSGTRTQRWTAAIGAPLALLLIIGTWSALANDDSEQKAQPQSTSASTQFSTETPSTSPTQTQTQDAVVTSILAGDTVGVLRDNKPETVRLIGIDAPEVAGSPAGLQCWAVESVQFASETLLQQEVRLVPDATQGDLDASGMTLTYVLLPDGRDFSVLSAGAGHARSYTTVAPATKNPEIVAAEQAARTASLGLWGPPCNGGLAPPPPVSVSEPAITVQPAPPPPPIPPPETGTDPRFRTCGQARAAGYGPYRIGIDPEYRWYEDKDRDGVVCD